MLAEITNAEYASALDRRAARVLDDAGVSKPPVDAVAVANSLGIAVARDRRMQGRARLARIAMPGGRRRAAIFVGLNDRPERLQFAVAHELGEFFAKDVFEDLHVDPTEAPASTREQIANRFASRLLLPTPWFADLGAAAGWDLLVLKQRFPTSSHELIAGRMLDMPMPIVMTLFDQGAIGWRRKNVGGGVPPVFPQERATWRRAHEGASVAIEERRLPAGVVRLACWPIHEPGWQREILRTELIETA